MPSDQITQSSLSESINGVINAINGELATVLFYDVFPGEGEMPFLVAWLIVGAVFLTLRFGFINLRMMGHALAILRGKYHSHSETGETTPFQALTVALSATVGLGNIAGVAIAIIIGGPGAIVWMILAGFFGMTTKFTEVTLGQIYREVRPDGKIMGGGMEYLSRGFAELGWATIGKILAGLFAFFTICGALGAGNAFQVSQAVGAASLQFPIFEGQQWILGIILAIAVGVVTIGGIHRIALAAQAIVPSMVIMYLAACIWIIGTNSDLIPAAIDTIFSSAFTMEAGIGGLIGVIVQGFKRAAFSSEAGIGSAAIAHSTSNVKYPVRQGFVALYEPFIDTIVICTMTALVITITGVYDAPAYSDLIQEKNGAALTLEAFRQGISWFPVILSISIILFAYSTMISWSYYGERCWTYLFGERFSMVFRIIFLVIIVIASIGSTSSILDLSDLLLLSMAIPNLIGLYVLHGKVVEAIKEYREKMDSGQIEAEEATT